MLELLNSVKGDRDDPRVKQNIQTKAEDMTSLLNDLVGVCNRYPEAANAQLVEENLELKAEQQLLAAADLIRRAAQELEFAPSGNDNPSKKVRALKQMGIDIDESEINAQLIEAAREVVNAGSALMEAAVVAQTERKQTIGNNAKYRNDPTWANGLISASKNVAGGVMLLVKTCNAAVRGAAEEEAIIALSGNVAAATAQLVTASRVRADANSQSQRQLDQCAKGVAMATDKLVIKAKKVGEFGDGLDDIIANPSFINKFEKQTEILRLEKALESARRNLGQINREEYRR
jgi:talin